MDSTSLPDHSLSVGGPWTQIVLFDLSKPRRVSDKSVIWHPYDTLRGHVLITATAEIEFDDIQISFEGISRICTTSASQCKNRTVRARSEQKFLTQKQEVSISAIQRLQTSVKTRSTGYRIPYYFVIPKWVIGTNNTIPEQCLLLPPSLAAGPQSDDTASISYYISVTAKILVQGRKEKDMLIASEPVTVVSLAEELPPTETRDFPAEYAESVSHSIRSPLIRTWLGTMAISTHEPHALSYNTTAPVGGTTALFQVDLHAAGLGNFHRQLRTITFMIESFVRVKTFRSTTPFPQLPSQDLLTSRGKIRLSDQVLKLETRRISNCKWQYWPGDGYGSIRTPEESSPCLASASGLYLGQRIMRLLCSNKVNEPSVTPQGLGVWRTKLAIPIQIASRLTPTFCCPLVARFYSLIFRVTVSKASTKRFELEVPLQVIHLPLTSTPPVDGRYVPFDRARPPSTADAIGAEPDTVGDQRNVLNEQFLPMYEVR